MKKILISLFIISLICFSSLIVEAISEKQETVWYNFENSYGDSGYASHNAYGYNSTFSSEIKKLGSYSLNLSRADDYINLTGFNLNNTNWSYCYWGYLNNTGNMHEISQLPGSLGFRTRTSATEIRFWDAKSKVSIFTQKNTGEGEWVHRCLIYVNETNNLSSYQNGTIQDSLVTTNFTSNISGVNTPLFIGAYQPNIPAEQFHGYMDDFRIWVNYSLSKDDVTELYNSGTGSIYTLSPLGVRVNLLLPVSGDSFSSSKINFSSNSSALSGAHTLRNVTWLVWYSNGTLYNKTTRIISGTYNQTNITINGFGYGNYKWNIYSCSKNASSTDCSSYPNNYTLSVGASLNGESYDSWAWETESKRFGINVSLISGATLYSAQLVYNGSDYEGDYLNEISNNWTIWKSIDIPEVNGDSETFSFYWNLTYEQENGNFIYQNFTSHTQLVKNISLGDCGGGRTTVSLNFSAWDEQNLTRIKGFNFKSTFFYWLGNSSVRKNISFENYNLMQKQLCIFPDNVSYYLVNSDITYEGNYSGYVQRDYIFENDTISNVTREVFLYLLNSSSSTTFILKVQDNYQKGVDGAVIYTERYYPQTGQYRIVQIGRTDENGKTSGYFEIEKVDYRFTIKQNGITNLRTSKQKVIPESTPYTIIFTIGEILDLPWANFDELAKLSYDLVFNTSTNITKFTYLDSSRNFTRGRLVVEKVMFNQSNQIICNITSTKPEATLSCDVSGYSGTIISKAYITRNNVERLLAVTSNILQRVVEIFGSVGVLMGFFILLTSCMAFLWHPIAGIISLNVSMIFVNLIGLISFSPVWIFGIISVSIILIFIIKD